MRLTPILFIAAALAIFSLAVSPVYGHAFGQRYDLPIPLSYFLLGAAVTVALSFVVIGMFVQKGREKFAYPRLNLLGVPLVGAILSSGICGGRRPGNLGGDVSASASDRIPWNQPAHRQPVPYVHLDNLVGGNGLCGRAAGQRVDVRQSVEDYL